MHGSLVGVEIVAAAEGFVYMSAKFSKGRKADDILHRECGLRVGVGESGCRGKYRPALAAG